MIAAFFISQTMATKTINTNKNDYARPVTKKGNKKNVFPFNKVTVKKQSSNQ